MTIAMETTVRMIAERLGFAVVTVTPATSGFSGARVWRVTSRDGASIALRRWPPGTDTGRVRAMADMMSFLVDRGFKMIARPRHSPGRDVCVVHDSDLWHAETWQPGTADFETSPTPARAGTVGRLLARLHTTLANYEHSHRLFRRRIGGSPTLAQRAETAAALAGAFIPHDDAARSLVATAVATLPSLTQRLRDAAAIEQPLTVCLRDLWHDSVLWTGDEVTGLIDLAAARIDTPLGDISRLFGSLCGEDASLWDAALEGYGSIRRLRPSDHESLRLLVDSETVLAFLKWQQQLGDRPRDTLSPPARRRYDHYAARVQAIVVSR